MGNHLNNQIVCPKYLALCCTNTTASKNTSQDEAPELYHSQREIIHSSMNILLYTWLQNK